jgi:hypothetical protein
MQELHERPKSFSRALLFVLGISLLLNWVGIGWGLPAWRGWAMDEIIPAEVLAGMEQYFSNGWYGKYPPLHYYLLALFYFPILFLRGASAATVGNDLQLYTILYAIGRFISVVMGTAIVYLVYRIGCELFEHRAAVFAALITALGGPFVFYAKTVNLEVPYIFWFSLSLLFFVRVIKRHALGDYVFFTLAAVCAVCTKDQAYGFYVFAPIPIVMSAYVQAKAAAPEATFGKTLFARKNFIALGAGIVLFALLQNWPFNFSGFLMHLRTLLGTASKGYQIYPRTLAGYWEMSVQAVRHLRFALGWPAFIVCLLGVARELMRKKKDYLLLSILVLVLSYYITFICLVMYHYERFMIPVALMLALFGGRLLSDGFNWKPGPPWAKKVVFSLMSAIMLWNPVSVNALMVMDSRYKVERWMKRNIHPDHSVGFIGFVESFPRSWGIRQRHFFFSPQAPRIERIKPDYLILNRESTIGDPTFDEGPRLEKIGYVLVLQYQTPLKWTSFNRETFFDNGRKILYSNLDKINPEIRIYWLNDHNQGPGPSLLERP